LHDCNHRELRLDAAGIAQGLQFPARKGWPAIAVAEALHIKSTAPGKLRRAPPFRVSWEDQAHIGALAAALTCFAASSTPARGAATNQEIEIHAKGVVVEQLLVDPRSVAAMTPRPVRSKMAASAASVTAERSDG
jgi:hypothetical protein